MGRRDRPWQFPHEDLLVYQDSLEFLRRIDGLTCPAGWAELKRQTARAAVSICLNICEGRGQRSVGNSGMNHYRIALGSAAECHGALQALEILGHTNLEHSIELSRTIGARLTGLIRRSP